MSREMISTAVTLRVEVEKARRCCRKLLVELGRQRVEIAALTESLRLVEEAYRVSECDRTKLEQHQVELKQQAIEMREQLHEVRSEAAAKTRQLNHQLDEVHNKLATKEAEYASLQTELARRNVAFEVLERQLQHLEQRSEQALRTLRSDVAQELGETLSQFSSLRGREPQVIQGLTMESVFEDFLDWFERSLGERPRRFPTKRDGLEDGSIDLDADATGMDTLLSMYDWSPARPFEGLTPGERRVRFKVIRWGWRANGHVIRPAIVAPLEEDQHG
jgi:hypothetical protein